MITKGEIILPEYEQLKKLMSNPKLFNEIINKFKENEYMQSFHRTIPELNDAELFGCKNNRKR